MSAGDRRSVAFVGTLATLAIMRIFLLFGTTVLSFFCITLAAFKVMGGIVRDGVKPAGWLGDHRRGSTGNAVDCGAGGADDHRDFRQS